MSEASTGDKIEITLTRQELLVVLNALNETFEAVEAWEFATRVGAEISQVQDLRARLSGIADGASD